MVHRDWEVPAAIGIVYVTVLIVTAVAASRRECPHRGKSRSELSAPSPPQK